MNNSIDILKEKSRNAKTKRALKLVWKRAKLQKKRNKQPDKELNYFIYNLENKIKNWK